MKFVVIFILQFHLLFGESPSNQNNQIRKIRDIKDLFGRSKYDRVYSRYHLIHRKVNNDDYEDNSDDIDDYKNKWSNIVGHGGSRYRRSYNIYGNHRSYNNDVDTDYDDDNSNEFYEGHDRRYGSNFYRNRNSNYWYRYASNNNGDNSDDRDNDRNGARNNWNRHDRGNGRSGHKHTHLYRTEVVMPSGTKKNITDPPKSDAWHCGDGENPTFIRLRPEGTMGKVEYTLVKEEMENTWGAPFTNTIIMIEKITNNCLWKRYRYRQKQIKEESEDINEKLLFYGADVTTTAYVLIQGFDERNLTLSSTLWGAGFCFASNSSISHTFATAAADGTRYMLICRVTLGKIQTLPAGTIAAHPPVGYNSVKGDNEYVIYRGEQAYPEYVITYRSHACKDCKLQYEFTGVSDHSGNYSRHTRAAYDRRHHSRYYDNQKIFHQMTELVMPTGRIFQVPSISPTLNWSCGMKTKVVKLDTGTKRGAREFNIVAKEMQNTIVEHPNCEQSGGCFDRYNIIKIHKIVEACSWRKYQARKRDVEIESGSANERMLFHGTSAVRDIVDTGFDERYASSNGQFGAGLYFARHSSLANQFAFGYFGGNGCSKHHDKNCYICERHMFLCRVILGKEKRLVMIQNLPHPPPGHHSVVGTPTKTGFKYPEYVIYRGEQAYPEYLITYKIARPRSEEDCSSEDSSHRRN